MLKNKNIVALVTFVLALVALLITFVAAGGGTENAILRVMWFGGAQGAALTLLVMTVFIFLAGGLPMPPRIVGAVLAGLGVLIGLVALSIQVDNDFTLPFLKNFGFGSALVFLALAAYIGTRNPDLESQESKPPIANG